jgi:hypothetical protein
MPAGEEFAVFFSRPLIGQDWPFSLNGYLTTATTPSQEVAGGLWDQ